MQTRTLTIKPETRKVNQEERTVELSVSSETPYERFFGNEILGHKSEEIRLDRLNDGGAVLVDHYGDQVGVVEKAYVDGDKLRAVIRFSKNQRGEEILTDIADGIRRNVSIGYMVHEMVMEKQEEDKNTYRVTDWEPFEVSIVSVPADSSVGVGRKVDKTITDSNNNTKENVMPETSVKQNETPEVKINVDAIRQEARKAEIERVDEITAVAEKYDMPVKEVREAINGNMSASKFKDLVLEKQIQKQENSPIAQTVEMSKKERKTYSLARAIKSQLPEFSRQNSFEREISDEFIKQTGYKAQGIVVPHVIMEKYTRDFQATASTAGEELVPTEHLGSQFIDMMKEQTIMTQLGVRMVRTTGGNITIPKKTSATTFYWAATENASLTESTPATTNVTAEPHRGGITSDISKQLIIQGDPAADVILTDDILEEISLGLEEAYFQGSGSSGEPEGLFTITGTESINGATISWEKVASFYTALRNNQVRGNNMKWVMTPAVYQLLRTRQVVSGESLMLIPFNSKELDGRPYFDTTNIPDDSLVLGDFTKSMMLLWDGIDMVVDPYTLAKTGMIRITAQQLADVVFRHASAFAISTTVS